MTKIIEQTTSKFWIDVIYSSSRVVVNIPTSDIQSASSETLWLHSNILKTHLFLPNWYKKGIDLSAGIIHANEVNCKL